MTYPLATLPPLLVSDSLFLWAYLLRSPLSGAGEERPRAAAQRAGVSLRVGGLWCLAHAMPTFRPHSILSSERDWMNKP